MICAAPTAPTKAFGFASEGQHRCVRYIFWNNSGRTMTQFTGPVNELFKRALQKMCCSIPGQEISVEWRLLSRSIALVFQGIRMLLPLPCSFPFGSISRRKRTFTLVMPFRESWHDFWGVVTQRGRPWTCSCGYDIYYNVWNIFTIKENRAILQNWTDVSTKTMINNSFHVQ